MNTAVILQQCLSTPGYTGAWSGIFYDMLRLTTQRHAAYARAHAFDYIVNFGDIHPGKQGGAWDKVQMILDALNRGYEYVVWLDTDAAVMNFGADLREALPADKFIGAAKHDPANSAYLRACNVPAHHNVGVLYVRNGKRTRAFFRDWLAAWPGKERWAEQGAFNDLITGRYADMFTTVDDAWNATVNVNMVPRPNVAGWHGVMPPQKRLDMMREALTDDFLRYRI